MQARIHRLDSMSAHADRGESMRWLRTPPNARERLYLVHGEPPSMDALTQSIEQQLGWSPHTPSHQAMISI